MKVFITGGTGIIGQAIVKALLQRHTEVIVLTRSAAKAKALWPTQVTIVEGDPIYAGDWQKAVAGVDAVINLAGESWLTKKWDAQFRQKLHDSRIDTTRYLVEAIEVLPSNDRPTSFLSASSIDYYAFADNPGFDDDKIHEQETGGESYLAGLCWDWEDEAKPLQDLGLTLSFMRMGLVLSQSGVFPRLSGPYRRLGLGTQWMSWIHLDDVVQAFLQVLDNKTQGVFNLVSPGNVRNCVFAKILAKERNQKAWLPLPSFLLKMKYGQVSEYIVKGRRAVPKALEDQGFVFRYPNLAQALRDLV